MEPMYNSGKATNTSCPHRYCCDYLQWHVDCEGCIHSTTDFTNLPVPGMPVKETSIKDSGDRTEFETGAVRDMREGKGRCDLMALEVVGDILGSVYNSDMEILKDIAAFMKSNETSWLYDALIVFADDAYNGETVTMFLEVAKHFEEGAKKYGPDNWKKGIPTYCYIDSAVRHYLKWLRGDTDEPHDRAFVWNIICCLWEVDYHK